MYDVEKKDCAALNLNPAVKNNLASQVIELASKNAAFANCGAVRQSSFASMAYASTAGFRLKRDPSRQKASETPISRSPAAPKPKPSRAKCEATLKGVASD
jgi:hypothetical protein